jgi:hypothetical protein
MLKKILGGITVLWIVALVAINVIIEQNSPNFSALSLVNIEVLAGESATCKNIGTCPGGCCKSNDAGCFA